MPFRDGMAHYEVAVGDKSDVHLRVFSTFTEALTPLPAEIGQMDHQLVQYFDSHTLPSKYPTETQVRVGQAHDHVCLCWGGHAGDSLAWTIQER